MKTNKLIKLLLILFFSSAYLYAQDSEAFYTTLDKIYMIEDDMSMEEVKTLFGSPPYDFYLNQENEIIILSFKYRKSFYEVERKRLNMPMAFRKKDQKLRDEKKIFCVFDSKNDKLLSYITAKGREDILSIIKNENYLGSFISKHKN